MIVLSIFISYRRRVFRRNYWFCGARGAGKRTIWPNVNVFAIIRRRAERTMVTYSVDRLLSWYHAHDTDNFALTGGLSGKSYGRLFVFDDVFTHVGQQDWVIAAVGACGLSQTNNTHFQTTYLLACPSKCYRILAKNSPKHVAIEVLRLGDERPFNVLDIACKRYRTDVIERTAASNWLLSNPNSIKR